jgi:predicted transcriptional regulator of viral defense system
MSTPAHSRLEGYLAALPPTFTATQARQAAISSRDLTILATGGDIEELSRGVYRRADAPATAHLDLLAICLRAPRAVVCGESALAIHELIDDIPTSVHIAIPRGTHRPSISYPPTTVTQYAAETFSLAVERFEAAPSEMIPMYSAARSVVDAMRHRRRFGETLALAALGRYLRREGRNGVRDLQEIARDLGALSIIRPSIEAVLA